MAYIEARARGDRTPLHEAIEEGHLGAAKCLVKYGADINKKSSLGSPLMHAINSEYIDLLEWLLHITATDLTHKSTYFGAAPESILFIAAREAKAESVRCLLRIYSRFTHSSMMVERYSVIAFFVLTSASEQRQVAS